MRTKGLFWRTVLFFDKRFSSFYVPDIRWRRRKAESAGVFPVGIQAAELAAAQGKGKPGLTVVCGGAVKSIEQITDSAGVPGFFEEVPQLLQD